MTALHVRALAVWTPRFPSLEAFGERRASEPSLPAASILGARARGRASVLTRMIAEVAARAAEQARLELSRARLLVGSAYGEMETTAQLLAMMGEGDGALSPARFQGSVHNAAAGVLSITTGNPGFSSCIAAGAATTAALLFEARALLAERGGELLVIMADEKLPAFFAENPAFEPAAAACVLSAHAGAALATLRSFEPAHEAPPAALAELGPTPVAPMLALIDAALRRADHVVLPAIAGALRVGLSYAAPQSEDA